MKMSFEDEDIREFLAGYRVSGPGHDLVARVKRLMREELLHGATHAETAKNWPRGAVMFLTGLAVVLVLNLFYTFTVGTVLKLTLPAEWTVYVVRSMFWMPAAGAVLMAGVLLIVTFKLLQARNDRMLESDARVSEI